MLVQIASIIASTALVLPQTPGPNPPAQGGQQRPSSQPATPGQVNPAQPRTDHGHLHLHRSDKLLGMNVQDKNQGQVGTIDDMILLPNGQIAYAVLAGPDQGKLYTVPWNTLSVDAPAPPPGDNMPPTSDIPPMPQGGVIKIEKDRILAGPSFDRTNWTKTAADRDYFSQVDTYYGGSSARADTLGRPVEAGAALGMTQLRSSQLRNQAIVDAQGNTIGNVSQVVFDPSGSRVNYVAVTLTNPQSGAPRTIAVPWEALRVGRAASDPTVPPGAVKTQFTLTTPVEKLSGAPEFRPGDAEWRRMSDPKYIDDLYTYYSVRPYWNAAGTMDGSKRMPMDGTTEPKQPR